MEEVEENKRLYEENIALYESTKKARFPYEEEIDKFFKLYSFLNWEAKDTKLVNSKVYGGKKGYISWREAYMMLLMSKTKGRYIENLFKRGNIIL